MKDRPKERWAVSLAGLVFVMSVVWFGALSINREEVNLSAGSFAAEDYQSIDLPTDDGTGQVLWVAAEPMSRGPEWLYDVFTPPEVYYDTNSGLFRLIPPSRKGAVSTESKSHIKDAIGIILHAVDREPFPLQLIGFVGEPGHYHGAFANKVTHETLLLREGAVVDNLQMVVREFRVETVAREIPDSMTVNERQAVAVIIDQHTGMEMRLRQGETARASGLQAWVSVDESGRVKAVGEGQWLDAGEEQFLIEKIRLAPPEIDVIKNNHPDGASEAYTLRLMAPESP